MGRVIKFRVWDEISKTMWNPEQGGNYCLTQIGSICTDETDDGGILENRTYRCKAMQFTGLTDKNGVEIYDGDIVSAEYTRNTEVCYDEDKGFTPMQPIIRDEYPTESWVVIGNIYQNPELLK